MISINQQGKGVPKMKIETRELEVGGLSFCGSN